jgi:hypothetical protein
MLLLRCFALLLLIVGLAGCTEGQKSNPLPRAGKSTRTTPPADGERKAPGTPRDRGDPAQRTFRPDAPEK